MLAIQPPLLKQANQSALAGILLFAMVLLTIVVGFIPEFFSYLAWPIGLSASMAALLLVRNVGVGPRIQVGLLLVLGILLLTVSYQRGATISVIDVITRNTGLISMILSVGFLKLIVVPDSGLAEILPSGRRAYFNTLFSVSLFGSVINISAPVLIADRLTESKPMDLFTAASITRVFVMCAAWSPFFAGMAVVLTYVEDLDLIVVMMCGFPSAVVSLFLVYYLGIRYGKGNADNFKGYPLKVSSLWVPTLLALSVIVMKRLLPELSILVIIALSALLVCFSVLIYRQGISGTAYTISRYVTSILPGSVNELLLFLAAGVLAAGLTGLVDVGLVSAPIESFTVTTACLLLAGMLLVAACGIHPVIQISGLTPLVMDAMPDPTLLASTYLFAWSLGTCASPLSGTHLVFQGRYGIPAWKAAVHNWPYVGIMYIVAVVTLLVSASLRSL